MIVSFTPNPALDLTLEVAAVEIGGVNRADASHLDPGGKGINVSRMVHRLGGETLALGVLGGHVGKLAERALRKEGVPTDMVWIRAETRLNVILQDTVTRDGTRVYDRGPAAGASTLERVDELLERRLREATVFVTTGSLLPGMREDLHRRVLERAKDVDTRTILDASGRVLADALDARPDLIKPNAQEAGEILGRTLADEADVIRAAEELRRRGAAAVVISRGGLGAILACDEGVFRAVPPTVELNSTVGSGDSMVAALALAMARGDPLSEGLRLGSAAGAATAASQGTQLGTADEVNELLPAVVLEQV